MPAHCMSSSVHWKGSRMGLPAFLKTGAASGSALTGSTLDGSCAQIVPKSTNAAAANRIYANDSSSGRLWLFLWQMVYSKTLR